MCSRKVLLHPMIHLLVPAALRCLNTSEVEKVHPDVRGHRWPPLAMSFWMHRNIFTQIPKKLKLFQAEQQKYQILDASQELNDFNSQQLSKPIVWHFWRTLLNPSRDLLKHSLHLSTHLEQPNSCWKPPLLSKEGSRCWNPSKSIARTLLQHQQRCSWRGPSGMMRKMNPPALLLLLPMGVVGGDRHTAKSHLVCGHWTAKGGGWTSRAAHQHP